MSELKTTFDVPTDWSKRWPCSTLAGCHVSMGEAANGDLVELTVTRNGEEVSTTDLEAAELEAAREQYVYVAEARTLGEDAGKAAASWVTDGNSDVAERGRVLAMMQAGDPAADDYLPQSPNLSGEMAGDPTPQSLFEEVTGRDASTDADSDLMGELSDAWEEGAGEVFAPECERLLLAFTEPVEVGEIVEGYIQCALWSEVNPDTGTAWEGEDTAPSEELESEARADCRRFWEANSETVERFLELTGRDLGAVGHDLWLTRNGHGAGFWDRYMEAERDDRAEAEDLGEQLSDAARAFGTRDIYRGDDGQLYAG